MILIIDSHKKPVISHIQINFLCITCVLQHYIYYHIITILYIHMQDGIITTWSPSLVIQKGNIADQTASVFTQSYLGGPSRRSCLWVTDTTLLVSANILVVATTSRELAFYDVSTSVYKCKSKLISKLNEVQFKFNTQLLFFLIVTRNTSCCTVFNQLHKPIGKYMLYQMRLIIIFKIIILLSTIIGVGIFDLWRRKWEHSNAVVSQTV